MKRAILIGCGGGSASGKSTFARQLARVLAPLRVEVINQDHFYKSRGKVPKYFSAWDRRWHPGYDHPAAFRWRELRRFCRKPRKADVAILEGIMALHDRRLREMMDLKLYVSCPVRERLRRREFGGDVRRHRRYWRECVQPGHRRYVAPTRRYADLVFPSGAEAATRRRAVLRICREVRRMVCSPQANPGEEVTTGGGRRGTMERRWGRR